MKKYLYTLMAAVMLTGTMAHVAYADDRVEISTKADLTDAQKAELASQAAKMSAENAAGTTPANTASKVEVVKQWVDIGTAIGSGLAASAKELGIAANEFAQTPVGRFTVFLIAWHFIGSTLLHVFFALLWFFVLTTIFVWIYRRAAIAKTVTYYDKGAGPNGARKVKKIEPRAISDGLGGAMCVSVAVAVLIFVIMLCNL